MDVKCSDCKYWVRGFDVERTALGLCHLDPAPLEKVSDTWCGQHSSLQGFVLDAPHPDLGEPGHLYRMLPRS